MTEYGWGGKHKTKIGNFETKHSKSDSFQLLSIYVDDWMKLIVWMILKRVSRLLKLPALKFQGHSHREQAQRFLSQLCYKYVFPGQSQIFHSNHKYTIYLSWLVTFTPFHFLPKNMFYQFSCHSYVSLPPKQKYFGPEIIFSPHMLQRPLTNERKEQCGVKLVTLTFTEWLCPPTPFDALTPEFQRLWWASE